MTHHQCDCNQQKMERLVEERDEWKRDALSADAQAQAAWEKQKELEVRVGELEEALNEYASEGNWSIEGPETAPYWVWRGEFRQGTTAACAALSDTREEGE